jgi:hypothetical protein
MLDNASIEPFD